MHKTIPITAIPISPKEILTLVERVVTDKTVNGADVGKFENELAQYLDSNNVFSFNTGRTALYVGLQALGLNAGDEVIVPAYTCAIVFEVVLRLGLKPLTVDVNPETCNIDPEQIHKVISQKTRAIVAVHLFGYPCEMDAIIDISRQHGLYLIEDVAQALGAEYHDKKVGSFGDLAIFSFGPGKSLTGGEGGALAVNNESLIDMITQIHTRLPNPNWRWILHVMKNIIAMKTFSNSRLFPLARAQVEKSIKNTDEMIVQNCLTLLKNKLNPLFPTIALARMPNLSAAVLRKQLTRLDDFNKKRIINAETLTNRLSDIDEKEVKLPKIGSSVRSTFTRYILRVDTRIREHLIDELLKRGVDVQTLYYYIKELLPELSSRRHPYAEALSDSLIALPNHPLLTDTDIEAISSAFHEALEAIKCAFFL
jgi:dTDP-4-amino-4,6-dideoxygalactose transaminase